MTRFGRLLHAGLAALLFLSFARVVPASTLPAKQRSLDHWRSLTSPNTEPPDVFVRGDRVRFYFGSGTNVSVFSATWKNLRVPTDGYKVSSTLLRLDGGSSAREPARGWRPAIVISGLEWRRLSTNLLEALAPEAPGHGVYYQAFLSDRFLYRDTNGVARFALQSEKPPQVVIDHRFTIEETLDVLAKRIEEQLVRTHPGESLFVIMAPNASRFSEPLLLDRQRRQCVWLSPAALYDTTEQGIGFSATARGIADLVFKSHGLALLKNPVSSVARLADVGIQTTVQFLRLPLPKPATTPVALVRTNGMDLVEWERWLDTYTGTRRENGSLHLLIDGDRFFSRLRQAITDATNHVHINVYIFDRDDVAVSVADQLRQKSAKVKVKVIMDQMGSLAAGMTPPATPMPEDFIPPRSISSYLRNDSGVDVHPFLNTWLITDHSKVYLVDGQRAWIGGMNLGREYRFEWHDLMVELEGPVVASLENEFRRQWAQTSLLGDLAFTAAALTAPPKSPPSLEPDQWIPVRRLPTRTLWKPFSSAVQTSLRRARSYIYVENPYIFDKHVIAGLVRARERGVDVRVVLPRVNDFKAGGRGNMVTANYLLHHGVRVYFYPGMTHVKALLVDGWSCLGSGNLNNLSLHLCEEQNIATSDPVFAAQLKHDLFEEDFARSYELHQTISVDWVDSVADTVLESF